MGAHDAVSARIAAEAGFDAIWASSLGISARLGRCDRDEVPWCELTDVAEQISESVALPVILDGVDGGGSSNVVRQMARRSWRHGLAGLSLEDKAWPRSNSLAGQVKLLEPIEFAAKFSACREVVDKGDFLLIARTDAFIAGEQSEQVIERALCYAEAGADAVIVHSRASDVRQIAEFMAAWPGDCPIIVIPTTFPDVTLPELDSLGISGVVWANQLLRASMLAMRSVASLIRADDLDGKSPGGDQSLSAVLELGNCGWCERNSP